MDDDNDASKIVCTVGDYVCINSDEGDDTQYIARINHLYEVSGGKKKAVAQWMYRARDFTKFRPNDVLDPEELFFTKHVDDIYTSTIAGLCYIKFKVKDGSETQEFTTELGDPSWGKWPTFLCRQEAVRNFAASEYFTGDRLKELRKEAEEWKTKFENEPNVMNPAVSAATSPPVKKKPAAASKPIVVDDDDSDSVFEKEVAKPPVSKKKAVEDNGADAPERKRTKQDIEVTAPVTRTRKALAKVQPTTTSAIKLSPQQQQPQRKKQAKLVESEYDGPCLMESLWECFLQGKRMFPKSELFEVIGFLFLASQQQNNVQLPCPPLLKKTIENENFRSMLLPSLLSVLFPSTSSASKFKESLSKPATVSLLSTMQALEEAKPGVILGLLGHGNDLAIWFFPQQQPQSVFGSLLLRGDGFQTCLARFMNQNFVLRLLIDDNKEEDLMNLVTQSFSSLVTEQFRFGVRREGDFMFGIYPAVSCFSPLCIPNLTHLF